MTKSSYIRFYSGIILLIIGIFSPLAAFYIPDLPLHPAIKSIFIGGLVFGIPEVLMLLSIVLMGRESWEFLKGKFASALSFISPQKVSKTRYYIGVSLFSYCLVEGVMEIHSEFIQDWMGDYFLQYQWGMNVIFVLSFFIAGGEFWDKIRSIFIYSKEEA